MRFYFMSIEVVRPQIPPIQSEKDFFRGGNNLQSFLAFINYPWA